jgi:HYDIN/CFA65/VesB family protein
LGFWSIHNSGIGVGDFNGDGRLDIVTVGRDAITTNPVLSVFLQTTLNVLPTYINFGYVNAGTTSPPQTVTLTNIGNSNVSIGPLHIFGRSSDFKGDSTCTTLAPGASCTITGTFTPKFQGNFSASVQVSYKGAVGSPQIIEIVGTGD